MADFPLDCTNDLVSRVLARLGGDGHAMPSNRSQATTKASGVEGRCKSSLWTSLGGESRDTRLDGPLSQAGVNGTTVNTILEWPGTSRTPLEPPCPAVLDVGKNPLSLFLCFLRGTGSGTGAALARNLLVLLTHDGAEGLWPRNPSLVLDASSLLTKADILSVGSSGPCVGR